MLFKANIPINILRNVYRDFSWLITYIQPLQHRGILTPGAGVLYASSSINVGFNYRFQINNGF